MTTWDTSYSFRSLAEERRMAEVEEILEERGKTHGPYSEHANCAQCLKDTMRQFRNWPRLTDEQMESLEMIAHKVGRILTGEPNHQDHWDDIAGYAKLVSRSLNKPPMGFSPTPPNMDVHH